MSATDTRGHEPSFAELMEKGTTGSDHLEPGQQVEATVVRIGKDWIFLDFGAKSEGVLARSEVLDQEGHTTVREGDRLQTYFLSSRGSELLFTTRLGGGAAAAAHLEEAYQTGIPVNGRVEKEIKGGFEARVAGARAFCPYSQMELHRIANAAEYIGRSFDFRIVEFKEKGRNIILSRRALLEEERLRQKEKLKVSLQVGQTVRGVITSIRDFGAFVDIGGLEGLIPISEISWGRVEDIRGQLTEGQEVEVAVTRLDWDQDRFSFSLRETLPDPWDNLRARYPEGSVHRRTVVRLVPFGAFVTLEPGVDGLLHISHLGGGRKINHPREIIREGQEIEVRIEAIDAEKKRISLVPAEMNESPLAGEKPAKPVRREAQRPQPAEDRKEARQPMGTLGELLKAKMKEKKEK